MQLVARIRETFGVKMPLRHVFSAPTVRELSKEVARLMRARMVENARRNDRQSGQETPLKSLPISKLDPEVLADPYPLYRRLREEAPVHWDPYLHAWVVTRYEDVVTVLTRYSADRAPSPEFFESL